MTEADLHEMDVRINTAGQLPGDVNLAVKALLDAKVLTEDQAMTILRPLRQLSPALAAIQTQSNLLKDKLKDLAKPALPPGKVVADVGTAGAQDDDLVPLSGPDLADVIRSIYTGQFDAAAAERLGGIEAWNRYLAAYGPSIGGGRWYSPTSIVLAMQPMIRRTYASPRSWGLANGLPSANDLPKQWEGFEPTFAGGHTLPLPG